MKKYLLLITALCCFAHGKHVVRIDNSSEDNVYLDVTNKSAKVYDFLEAGTTYTYTYTTQLEFSRMRIGDTFCKGTATGVYKSGENSVLHLKVVGSDKACFVTSWEEPSFEL